MSRLPWEKSTILSEADPILPDSDNAPSVSEAVPALPELNPTPEPEAVEPPVE